MSAPTATTRALLLAAYLAGWHARRFDWARANCCIFAAGGVAEATGRDPMRGLPETPTQHAARRLVLHLGGALADACTRMLGNPPIAPTRAGLGDLVLMPVSAHPASGAVAICGGRLSAALTQDSGIVWLPTLNAVHAWRIDGEGLAA